MFCEQLPPSNVLSKGVLCTVGAQWLGQGFQERFCPPRQSKSAGLGCISLLNNARDVIQLHEDSDLVDAEGLVAFVWPGIVN